MNLFLISWPGGSWEASVKYAVTFLVIFLAAFWIATVFWTYRDIRQRTRGPAWPQRCTALERGLRRSEVGERLARILVQPRSALELDAIEVREHGLGHRVAGLGPGTPGDVGIEVLAAQRVGLAGQEVGVGSRLARDIEVDSLDPRKQVAQAVLVLGHGQPEVLAPKRVVPYERKDRAMQDGDLFRYPYPFSETEFLVSYKPEWGADRFGLYWMNADGEREHGH